MPEEAIDPIEPAHLRDEAGWTPRIFRYRPAPDLGDLVRRHWIPVWSLPAGATSVQRVLQYPVCLLAIDAQNAMLVGPTTGLGARSLTGDGWTVGTLLQPAAGALLIGRPVTELADSAVALADLDTIDGAGLAGGIRVAMGADPFSEQAHRAAAGQVEEQLRTVASVDEEGLLINRIVEFTETRSDVRRVSQVCAEFGLSERTLQRLAGRRLGLSPKWLIQRRRLHEAADLLRHRSTAFDLAAVAAALGYADQAHFTRDFRSVTGQTPGQFASAQRDT